MVTLAAMFWSGGGEMIHKILSMNRKSVSVCLLALGAGLTGGMAIGACLAKPHRERRVSGLQDRVNILSDHFQLLNHWLEIKNEGKSTVSYFEEMGYRHIAIYGMAELANRLAEDIAGSSVQIAYGIDRDVCCSIARIGEVYYPDDDLPEADAVIVTPYSSYEDIRAVLEKKVECPVISLEEVIWSI